MYDHLTSVSEIQLSYDPKRLNNPYIVCAVDAYVIFKEFFPEQSINLQERFVVMYLDRSSRVLGIYPTSIGGITGTVADIRLILGVALKTAATSIMLAHNHPSGSLKPSQRDIDLTKKMIEAARLLEISVMDHLILSPVEGKYYSFSDEGLI